MSELHERQVELAKMDQAILNAKNVLADLAKEKDAFLSARAEEAEERVMKVLEASKSALETASSNFAIVKKMRQEVDNVASELAKYHNDLKTKHSAFCEHVEAVNSKLDAKTADLSRQQQQLDKENKKLLAEWEQIKANRSILDKQEKYIKDQRARLSAAMREYDRRS